MSNVIEYEGKKYRLIDNAEISDSRIFLTFLFNLIHFQVVPDYFYK